jgi:hypothetical protein
MFVFVSEGRYVRVKVGSEQVSCIVCGQTTAHDLVISGLSGRLRRGVPRSDIRHYSLCRACGTKIPQAQAEASGADAIDLTDRS